MKLIPIPSWLVLVLFAGFGFTDSALSEWSDDPSARTPISTAPNRQFHPDLIRVDDGFVTTWQDQRRTDYIDVYAQKFDIDGEMLWPENGRVIAEGAAGVLSFTVQLNTGLAPDGAGGALVAWDDDNYQGYATRISPEAEVAWGDPGLPIQNPDTAVAMAQGWPATDNYDFAADSEGGAFAPTGIWLGRLDAEGRLRTNWFDIQIARTGMPLRLVPVVESDAKDGVIVVWHQGDTYFADGLFARKLVDPETAWPALPDTFDDPWGQVAVYDPEPSLYICRLEAVSDGAGGVIVSWMDARTGDMRLYVQRIDKDGNVLWQEGGVALNGPQTDTGCNWAMRLHAAADGNGGVVVVWSNATPRTVRAQLVSSEGMPLWQDGGVLVAEDTGLYSDIVPQGVVSASDGNFILLYHSDDNGQLLAQKLGADDGGLLWGTGRVVFDQCFTPYYDVAKIVSDGQAGAIVVFPSCGGDDNLYAHRLSEQLPDLTVNRILAPRMLRDDKPVNVRITLGNQGAVDLDGTYAVTLFLDDEWLEEAEVTDLPAAGDEITVNLNGVHIPALSAGNHSLEVVVDTYDEIPESNEENNSTAIKVRMK